MMVAAAPPDKEALKAQAAGRWREILINVAGIPAETLNAKKEHPCPKCGGSTRFRFIDEQQGAVRCSHCFADKCGDGIAAVSWARSVSFTDALTLIGDYLGMTSPNGHHARNGQRLSEAEILRVVCSAKRMPETSAVAFGGRVSARGKSELQFPGYDEQLSRCGTFTIDANGKGLWSAGDTAGVFLPHDAAGNPILPQPGETWLFVEGVKDSAALMALGYKVAGLPTSSLNAKFARLFFGVNVIIVPDLDTPGAEGAKKTKARLEDIARSIRIARLPGEKRESGGEDVRDILAKQDGEKLVRQAIADAQGDEDSVRKPITYKVISCAELASGDFSIEFLIENTMVAGQPLVIAGAMKVLKTSFIVDAAISLATAGYFLGRLRVDRACRVMVMTGESGMGTIQEHAHNVCKAAGKKLSDIATLFWSEDLPKFGDAAHIEAIEQLLTDYEIEVLFIDPAYLCLPSADAANVMAQGELLRTMAEACRRIGVTMVLCHHTKRHTGRDPHDVPELSDIAWAGFAEFARQWWLIGRRERYEPGTGSHRLWLSIGGSAGHSGLWAVDVEEGLRTDPDGRRWEVTVRAPNEARDESERGRDERRERQRAEQHERRLINDKGAIVRAMTAMGHPDTGKVIRERAGMPGSRYTVANAALIEEGIVEPCQVFKLPRKQPYDGFKLKDVDIPL